MKKSRLSKKAIWIGYSYKESKKVVGIGGTVVVIYAVKRQGYP